LGLLARLIYVSSCGHLFLLVLLVLLRLLRLSPNNPDTCLSLEHAWSLSCKELSYLLPSERD